MPSLLIVDQDVFNCGWGGSTRRLMDLGHGLAALGWKCSIVSGARSLPPPPDSPEAHFPGRVFRTPFRGLTYPDFIPNRRGLRSVWTRLNLSRLFFSDPESQGWAARLRERYNPQELVGEIPDVVWGISYGDLRGIVAARDLARSFSCPLVFEIQDPVPPPHATLSRCEQAALESCLESAKAIVTTTETLARHLEDTYQGAKGKTWVEYLSYDEAVPVDSRVTLQSRDRLLLLYVGTLSGGTHPHQRNAMALIRGIAQARARDPSAEIQLRLVGPGRGMREAVVRAHELGLGGAVSSFPPVDHWKALEHMMGADVLLVIKYQDPAFNMQVPGKIFQYFPFGKPILGIMGECEAAEILRRSGLGIVVPHGDIEGIADALLVLWRDRARLQEVLSPNREYIGTFSRDRMAARVDCRLRAMLSAARLGEQVKGKE